MKVGLFGTNFGLACDVNAMIHIAKAAEAASLLPCDSRKR
jgi:hypothetical protein